MGKNMSTPALMGIWFVTSMLMSFVLFGTFMIPGINFVGVPAVVMFSGLVHMIFISMIIIRQVQGSKSKFTNYKRNNKIISGNNNNVPISLGIDPSNKKNKRD